MFSRIMRSSNGPVWPRVPMMDAFTSCPLAYIPLSEAVMTSLMFRPFSNASSMRSPLAPNSFESFEPMPMLQSWKILGARFLKSVSVSASLVLSLVKVHSS